MKNSCKKILLLIVFVALLSGCAREDPANPTGGGEIALPEFSAEVPTIPAFTDPIDPTEFHFICPQFDLQYNLSDVLKYCSCDFISIPLISRTELDPETIAVSLPLENIPYTVTVNPCPLGEQMDYYLYKCYAKYDWQEEARMDLFVKKIESALPPPEVGTQIDIADYGITMEEWNLRKAYFNREKIFSDKYLHMNGAILPGTLSNFYAYEVHIQFNYDLENLKEDAFTYMDVSWPGVSFRQDCGTIRFYTGEPTEGMYWPQDVLSDFGGIGGIGSAGMPYGMPLGQNICFLTTDRTIILNDLSFLSNTTSLVSCRIITRGVVAMDLDWDGCTPISLPAGTYAEIRSSFSDTQLATEVVGGRIMQRLGFEAEGEQCSIVGCTILYRAPDFYELAAIYFDGVDVQSYYRNYYYPVIMGMEE